jgi:hypothetical protein
MGDRANFGFRQSNGDVIVLYGHWAGHEMLAQLASAVDAARPRWTDEGYATRIAISQLVGQDWESTTGWGIYINTIPDNEHKIPVIDWRSGTFSLHEEASYDESTKVHGMSDEPMFSQTLDAFVNKYSLVLSK